MKNYLSLKNISAGYGKKKVLDGITLDIGRGEFCGIIGPNGAGKTTLFRTINGICPPWRGELLLKEKPISLISRKERARCIATMPQFLELPFSITVEECVRMGRYPHRARWQPFTSEDVHSVEEALRLTGTMEIRHMPLNELSGGERQRALLAQALAQEPELLLLDEPTAHLDIGHQVDIMDLVRELNITRGTTVVTVLHDLNLAGEYCSRLVLMDRGAIAAQGAPEEVLTYQTIERVYRTVVVVNSNPVSHKPYVVSVSKHHLKSNGD